MTANRILSHSEIEHKIKRIAYQIYETFVEDESIVIAGIANNGFIFAEKIASVLQTISPIEVILCEVFMNKQNPNSEITTSIPKEMYQNKGIVLVDDVLNSGSTLMYGVKHFLEVPLKKFKTAVLVDRNHKKYPIKVDFKGISLSTTSLEHVTVVFEENNSYAVLDYQCSNFFYNFFYTFSIYRNLKSGLVVVKTSIKKMFGYKFMEIFCA